MFKILIVTLIVIVLFGGGWWVWSVNSNANHEKPEQTATSNTKVEVSTDINVYRNEEWGFQFEYPSDWNVREPAFVGASLFNMAVEPINSYSVDAILINITPKQWIISAHKKMAARGVVFEETTFKGMDAVFSNTADPISGFRKNYYVLVNDEYWIHLSGEKQQEEVFDDFIVSFQFLDQ